MGTATTAKSETPIGGREARAGVGCYAGRVDTAEPAPDNEGLEHAKELQKFLVVGLGSLVALLALVMVVAAFLVYRTANAPEAPSESPATIEVASTDLVETPEAGGVEPDEEGFGEEFGERNPDSRQESPVSFEEPSTPFGEEPPTFEDPAMSGEEEVPPAEEAPASFEGPAPGLTERPPRSGGKPSASPQAPEEGTGRPGPDLEAPRQPPATRPAPRKPSKLASAAALARRGDSGAGAAFRDAILLEPAETLARNLKAHRAAFAGLPAKQRADGILAVLVRADEHLDKQRARQARPLVSWTLSFPGPHQQRAYVQLGRARDALGDTKGAAWAYKKVADLAKLGESVPASLSLEAFERELSRQATSSAAARLTHTRLVRAKRDYASKGIAAVRGELEDVVRLYPEGRTPLSQVYAEEAREAMEAGRHAEVFPLAKASLDLDSKNLLAHRSLGDLALLVNNDWDKARYHLRLTLGYAGLLP